MTTSTKTGDELDERTNAEDMAMAKAMDGVWRKAFKSPLADLVRELKAVEAEFVMRAGDDDVSVLETKRRVAESIFKLSVEYDQPFDTSRNLWNDVLRLGFSNLFGTYTLSWNWGQCCWLNKEPEAGLAVIEPLIAEIARLLAEPSITEEAASIRQSYLKSLGELRDRLKAQQGNP